MDLALALDCVPDDIDARMAEVRHRVKAQLRSPLAGRLSLFWASWKDLAQPTGRGRFPLVDQYDLVHHGLRLTGEDHRSQVILPKGDVLRDRLIEEAAGFMLENLAIPDRDAALLSPERLVAQGQREVAKAVLFPVRFLYTVTEGTPASNAEAMAQLV